MNANGLKITWGGNWTRNKKKIVRPAIEGALELAVDGLCFLGVSPPETHITTVRRVGNHNPFCGVTNNKGIELHLTSDQIRYRKLSKYFGEIALTAVHELIHYVRAKQFPEREDLAELTVTEGLAYFGESMLASLLLKPKEFDNFCEEIEENSATIKNLKAPLAADISLSRGSLTQAQYVKWMLPVSDTDIPPGIKIGVLSVIQEINSGHSIAEVIAMPPERVLGLVHETAA